MTKDLTVGNPIKAIIIMTIPIMFGNLFQQLYSIVDTIIVGRYLGSGALAAVGSTASLYYLILWFLNGISNGYAIVVARDFGAGQKGRLRRDVCLALELSAAVTIVLSLVWLGFLRKFLIFMNTPEEILQDAYSYIFVIIAGMVVTILYNICASILRAMGDSKTPLYFLILSSVLNIFLDIVFINVFYMGVMGAALATILSQAVSGIMCFIYMYSRFEIIRFGKEDWKFDPKCAKEMLSYGIPSGLNGAATALGILILQFAINCYGTNVIAGYTSAIKVQNFAEIPMFAYCMTMINFEGQNLGAGKPRNMRKGFIQCQILGLATASVLGILLFFFGTAFSSIFVDDGAAASVVEFAGNYLRFAAPFFLPYSILIITRSSLQGMGDKIAPVANGVIETISRTCFSIYLIHHTSERILCMVNPIIWAIGAVALTCMYFYRWNIIKKTIPMED